MLAPRFLPLVFKQVFRQRIRTILTVCGVATAMFLFCTVQAMQSGMQAATEANAADTTLIVYRENRFCPFTSRLPQNYESRIAQIAGVKSVIPMKITVSNCRTSLDVVTFRGVPADVFSTTHAPELTVVSGSIDDWTRRQDAAIVGETLATRRGLKTGDRFDANGITVSVAAIVRSDEPQDKNVAYVHLDFLQRAPGVKQLGVVTQFNVKVDDPKRLKDISEEIDALFKNDQAPTQTRSEKDFVARSAGDLLELIGFTRLLALGCVAAVLALVGNTVVLSVQDRIRDHAVLQTLGFSSGLIARLIILEGLVVSLIGGIVGTIAAIGVLHWGQFSLSNEGLSINFEATPDVLLSGLAVAMVLGVLAGLVPAWQASRREIVTSFRAV
jgi:putative ABC transport system permease protein